MSSGPNYFIVYRLKGEYGFKGPYKDEETAEGIMYELMDKYPESYLSQESFSLFGDTGVSIEIVPSYAANLSTFRREFWQDYGGKFIDRPSGYHE